MDTIRICPQCRKPLPPEAPQGLCPLCLAKVALPSEATTVVGQAPANAPRPTPAAAAIPVEPPTPAALAPHFPQLEILELLGAGGMGMVYKARQPQLDRFVALKILSPEIAAKDTAFADRFLREARALARLNHPNIVSVFDFGQAGGFYYFIMEFMDGANLRQLLANHEITPREALSIIPKVCDALQFAHDEGVMHRDIKPENILLDRKGRVKIADFGLAKLFGAEHAAHSTLTHTGVVMGTPRYMAPEQIEKPQSVDHRADIYSLGVVFYEMLTGELPLGRFELPSHSVGVDVRLDEVVLRSLEKKPERRYQRASEVKTDVESIAGSAPPRLSTPAPAVAPVRPGDFQEAREQVGAAGLGLFIIGLLNAVLVLIAVMITFGAGETKPIPLLFGFTGGEPSMLIWGLFSGVIMFGARQMRRLASRDFVFFTSVLAMVPITSPLFLVGIPVGIWCLRMLKKPAVKEAFRATAAAAREGSSPAAAPPPAWQQWYSRRAGPVRFALRASAAVAGLLLLVVFLFIHRKSEDMNVGQQFSILETTTVGLGDPWLKIEHAFGKTHRSVNVLTWSFLAGAAGLLLLSAALALRRAEKRLRERGGGLGEPPLAAASARPRFSRKAIVGAAWAMLAVLALPSWIVARPVLDARAPQPAPPRIEVASLAPVPVIQPLLAQSAQPPLSSWGGKSRPTPLFFLGMIFLAVGLTAPIGTTIMGLMALHDIRHSRGMITGLPLALADALLFPLAALGGLIYWLCHLVNQVMREFASASALFRKETLVAPAALVLTLAVSAVIVWLAWRAAKKPVAG